MKRKPKIVYTWSRQMDKKDDGTHVSEWRVNWALVGANGEHMCSSDGQGYRDKTDARRAVNEVMWTLTGPNADISYNYPPCREVGPGRKPK